MEGMPLVVMQEDCLFYDLFLQGLGRGQGSTAGIRNVIHPNMD